MITLRFFFLLIILFVGFSFAKLYELVIITTLDITARYSRLIKIVNIFSIKFYSLKSLFSLVLVCKNLIPTPDGGDNMGVLYYIS